MCMTNSPTLFGPLIGPLIGSVILKHSLTKPMMLLGVALAGSSGLCSSSAAAVGDSSWTLCTRELELLEINITDVNQERIESLDSYGIRRRWAVGDVFFAIASQKSMREEAIDHVETSDDDPAATAWSISLVDGQVIRGRIEDSDDPDMLGYTIYTQDTIRSTAKIDLEHVLSISRQRTPAVEVADSDTIVTRSGDVLGGFIERIGTVNAIETPRGDVALKLDQIQSMHFANPAERVSGVYLSTIDGLVLRTDEFDFDFDHPTTVAVDGAGLGIGADSRTLWLLEPNSPSGIEVVDSDQRVVSLAQISPALIEPTGDRSWTPTPSVSLSEVHPVLSTIDLRAPVRVVYPLPKGSDRFACSIVAPINTWTDCIVVVESISYSGKRFELLRQRLNAQTPSVEINTELVDDTRELEIRVEPGEYGPIQDRVLIEEPRLLVSGS